MNPTCISISFIPLQMGCDLFTGSVINKDIIILNITFRSVYIYFLIIVVFVNTYDPELICFSNNFIIK